jgi:hypothetical protein
MHRLGFLALVLPLAGAAADARGQDAQACVDEVARLVERFPLDAEGEQARAIAGAAGARKGAALSEGQRRAIGSDIEQARAAGGRRDGKACLEHLNAARLALREGGLGGLQPGMATGGGALGAGTGGRGTGSGTAGQSPDALGGLGAGSTGGGVGGSSGSATGGGSTGGGGSAGGGSSGGGGS